MAIVLPTAADVQSSLAAWCEQYPLLESLIAQRTHPSTALRSLARSQYENGVTDTVVQMLMAAVALTPQDAGLWSDLGTVVKAAGRANEAIECFRISLQKDRSQPRAWASLGYLHAGLLQFVDAEKAFLAALELDERLGTALCGLGFVYFKQRRFELAIDRLKFAISCGEKDASVYGHLGLALCHVGDFAGAAAAFAEQARLQPESRAIRNWAEARMMDALIGGANAENALAIYRETAGGHAEDSSVAGAFRLLSTFGHHDAAITIGRHRLSAAPNDPVQQYLLSALERKAPVRAPDDYLRNHFDEYAETFDHDLVQILDYHVPEKLAALLKPGFTRVLDLGCGTGLAGPLLRPKSAHLTGVDISPRMLEKARLRGVYDALVESEIVAFLGATIDPYGLIFATDVLIYFGDLSPVMAAAAGALEAKGCFAFSIETTGNGDYTVLPSGRFAQSLTYIEKVSQPYFRVVMSRPTTIRIEAHRPVKGALICLERL